MMLFRKWVKQFRFNPDSLNQIYINTASGKLVPLSTFVTIQESIQPNSLTSFQQLNSATLSGMMMPGHTIAEGLNFFTKSGG